MNVVMLSYRDYAGSGNKLCKAIQANTDINIRLIIKESGKLDYDYDYSVEHCNKIFLQKILNKADIIHFKGDDLPLKRWNGLLIPNVPIVITVGGSGFRRNIQDKRNAKAWEAISKYIDVTDYRSTITPDLNYPEFDANYIQHCIDSESKENLWVKRDIPIIQHSPSSREKKGTDDFILPALKILKDRGYKFEIDIIENVPNAQCIERKKRATIFIDQMNQAGFYGVSALESMQYGIPVICHISEAAKKQSNGKIDEFCPIQSVELSVESLVNKLEDMLLNKNLEALSKKTKQWANCFHGESTVAGIWKKVYEKLYKDNEELIFKEKRKNLNFEHNPPDNYKKCIILNRKLGNINDFNYYPESSAYALQNSGLVKIVE
jgi:hypothetical protein